ncbi:MerR family transcriptional regulator [Oceanobacillus saliphilus]|uniref:MerR family transcriptional regulator n=1 Tax=Oceanobacillus saliphilus TaxID=2925834 RepID=UPI00201D8666|nr:MerR family transcriptional regulator [Oceanobacillus saliphilus]
MYNIKAVSKILDMPTVTIRSWETRYHAITPERTASGHRVYTEDNINDLKWLKKQVHENGMKVSQAVKQLHAIKEKQGNIPTLQGKHAEGNYQTQIEELYDTVRHMDSVRCHSLLDLCFSQFHYRTVFYEIIGPLMFKVGNAQEKGELHIAQEHMISNIVLQRFTNFFRVFETSSTLPKVMALCPQGENRQIGLLLFTLFLKENGYPVIYVGADTPLKGLDKLVKEKDVGMIAISTFRNKHASAIQRYIDSLSRTIPTLKFIVDGIDENERKEERYRWNIKASYDSWPQVLAEIHPE